MSEGGGVVFIPPVTPGHTAVWVYPNVLGDSGSAPQSATLPTRTILSVAGSGTYNTPPGVRRLYIRMVGGGGGGKGANVNALAVPPGDPGIASSFGTTVANPGAGGVDYSTRAGGSGGAGPASIRIAGGQGAGGALYAATNPVQTQITSPNGGSSAFGGNGGGCVGSSGGNGSPNSGSGGAGGCYVDSIGGGQHMAWGGSGSAAEYVELIIAPPAASYPYTVGAGGAGGIGNASNGGNGGSGVIIIDEYY